MPTTAPAHRTGSPEVDWTIERGRQLTSSAAVVRAGGRTRNALNPAQQAAVLVFDAWRAKLDDFDRYGWRNQQTIGDAITHLVEAYQGLAAAFGEPYVMGTEAVECVNGADLADPRKGGR
jgi:hypothetical protein